MEFLTNDQITQSFQSGFSQTLTNSVINTKNHFSQQALQIAINRMVTKPLSSQAIDFSKSLITIFVKTNYFSPDFPLFLSKTDTFVALNAFSADLPKGILFDGLADAGERIDRTIDHPLLLHLATLLFEAVIPFDSAFESHWWLARCLNVRQSLLGHKTESLRRRIAACFDCASGAGGFERPRAFYRELCIFYSQHWFSEKLKKTEKLAFQNVHFELEGALAKNTKFQQKSHAQLFLKIERTRETPSDPASAQVGAGCGHRIENVPLGDEVLLETPCFDEKPGADSARFGVGDAEEAQALFVHAVLHKKTPDAPEAQFMQRGFLVALERLIADEESVVPFYVRLAALFLRSKVEGGDLKTSFRAIAQFEELIRATESAPDAEAPADQSFWPTVGVVPHHCARKLCLAQAYLAHGCFASALDVFSQFSAWEPVVKCLLNSGRVGPAKERLHDLRRESGGGDDYSIFLYLGHANEDPKENYARAWVLSSGHCAEAKRCLGHIAMREQNWDEARKHYSDALKINYLFPEIWFRLAFCHQNAGALESAVEALVNCVTIEPDNFKAWNDLGSLYIKTKEFKPAFCALKRGTELNPSSWTTADNLLTVAMVLDDHNAATNCFLKILRLRPPQLKIDSSVVAWLLGRFPSHSTRSPGSSSAELSPTQTLSLRQKLDEIVRLLSSDFSPDGQAFGAMSAYFFASAVSGGEADAVLRPRMTAAAEFKKKQLRLLRESAGWETDAGRLKDVVAAVGDFVRIANVAGLSLSSTALFVEEKLTPACLRSGLGAEEVRGLLAMVNI